MALSKAQAKWQEESQIFFYEGKMYADGKVTLTKHSDIDYDTEKDIAYRIFTPFVDCRLEDFEKYDNDIWHDVKIYGSCDFSDNQRMVYGGIESCSLRYGGSFIALTSADNTLEWSMYFAETDPVVKVEVITKNDTQFLICGFEDYRSITINLKTLYMRM